MTSHSSVGAVGPGGARPPARTHPSVKRIPSRQGAATAAAGWRRRRDGRRRRGGAASGETPFRRRSVIELAHLLRRPPPLPRLLANLACAGALSQWASDVCLLLAAPVPRARLLRQIVRTSELAILSPTGTLPGTLKRIIRTHTTMLEAGRPQPAAMLGATVGATVGVASGGGGSSQPQPASKQPRLR